jgi:hypothetical protein
MVTKLTMGLLTVTYSSDKMLLPLSFSLTLQYNYLNIILLFLVTDSLLNNVIYTIYQYATV